MKKTILSLSIIITGVLTTSAQITITSADAITPGHVIIQANDSIPTVSEGSGGANQTWDMSALNEHTQDTLSFIPYAWAPNANFSSANMVAKQGWQNNFAYFNLSSDSLSIIGNHGEFNYAGTGVIVNQKLTPGEKIANFPFTYLSSTTNNYRTFTQFYFGGTIMGFQVDSVRDHSSVKKTIVTDGWGTLTTPDYTAIPTLRTRETKITYDSIDAYVVILGFGSWQNNIQTSADSAFQYVWWANGIGFPLVTAQMDSLGDLAKVTYVTSIANGVGEYANTENVNVFPNPAQNEIHFVSDAKRQNTIQLYDVAGRLIDELTLAENQTTINTSAYTNGLYTFSVTAKDKTVLNRGKFIISK